MTNKIYFKKLSDQAILPSRGSSLAAGLDLSSIETVTIEAGTKAIVSTGLAVAIPENTYLRIAPRSGLAAKHSIDVLAGVVDADYRGEIKVILVNLGRGSFTINKGDRIAQAILEKCVIAEVIETNDLDQTERGINGFGSTGIEGIKQ